MGVLIQRLARLSIMGLKIRCGMRRRCSDMCLIMDHDIIQWGSDMCSIILPLVVAEQW